MGAPRHAVVTFGAPAVRLTAVGPLGLVGPIHRAVFDAEGDEVADAPLGACVPLGGGGLAWALWSEQLVWWLGSRDRGQA